MANKTGRLVGEFDHFITVHVGGGPGKDPRHLQFRRTDIESVEETGELVLKGDAKPVHTLPCDCPKPENQIKVRVSESAVA